jgi:hypothetical protein
MVMLDALMVLRLRGVLVVGVLLVVIEQIGHAPTGAIQPGIVSLLMVLRVHAGGALGRVRPKLMWGKASVEERVGGESV